MNQNDEITNKISEFVDREEPQRIFLRKLRAFNEKWKTEFCVLNYYGIGGVGKTSLKNKFIDILENEKKHLDIDVIDTYYAQYDFGLPNMPKDKISILKKLKNQLYDADSNSFRFVLFDIALFIYNEKVGNDEENNSLLKANPLLNLFCSILEVLKMFKPALTLISVIVDIIDNESLVLSVSPKNKKQIKKKINKIKLYLTSDLNAFTSGSWKTDKMYLREIETCSVDQLYKNIHVYFSQDLKRIVSLKISKPIVFFVDTYDMFINEMNSNIPRSDDDFWLMKGNECFIRKTPGIFWVISGKNKLVWNEDDEFWKANLVEIEPTKQWAELNRSQKEGLLNSAFEVHLLGDLPEVDTERYLKYRGISDSNLCTTLYELTSGTPIYLDICVRNFEALPLNRRYDINEYGKDKSELVNCYLKNMKPENQRILFFLCLLGKWDDKKISTIRNEVVDIKQCDDQEFNRVLRGAFVYKDRWSNRKYIHQTVKTACLSIMDSRFKKKIYAEISRYAIKQINEFSDNSELESLIESTFYENTNYKTAYSAWKSINKVLDALEDASMYDVYKRYLKKLYNSVKHIFPDTGYEYIVLNRYIYSMSNDREYKNVKPYLLEDSNDTKEFNDISKKDLYYARMYRSNSLAILGFNKRALNVLERIRKNCLKEDICDKIMQSTYFLLNDYKNDLIMCEKIYEKNKSKFGEYGDKTLEAKKLKARALSNTGKIDEALDIYTEVYQKKKESLGDSNPVTILAKNAWVRGLCDIGKWDVALKEAKEAYDLIKGQLPEEDEGVLSIMRNLAMAYSKMDEPKEAFKLLDYLYSIKKGLLGEKHPDTLSIKGDYIFAYGNEKEFKKAVEVGEELLKQQKEVMGESNPEVCRTMNNLAFAYTKCKPKKIEAAIELYEDAYIQRKELLGECHINTLTTLNNLVSAEIELYEYDNNAIKIGKLGKDSQNAYDLCNKAESIDKDVIIVSKNNLGRVKELEEEFDDAIGYFNSALDDYKEQHEDKIEKKYLTIKHNLAHAYYSAGKKDTAKELFEELLKEKIAFMGENDPSTQKTKKYLDELSLCDE